MVHAINFRTIVAPIAAIELRASALAAPIHLTCNETEVIKNEGIMTTAGRVSSPTYSMELRKDIPMMFCPDKGAAKVWSSDYSLAVYPDRQELRDTQEKKSVSDSSLYMTLWEINREMLTMKYSCSGLSFHSGLVRQKNKSEREAVGTCGITPAPKANKI